MPKPYIPNDYWSQKARAEGYRARSAYKLEELDKRFGLFAKGQTVLDLGAAPGSWLQYAKKRIGDTGTAIGVDLRKIEPIEGVKTFVADITDEDEMERIISSINKSDERNCGSDASIDIIISDLAPSTSGIKGVDQWKSIELSHAVLSIVNRFIKRHGKTVLKVLQGEDYDSFIKELKREWQFVKPVRVRASRDRSKEIYLVLY